MTLLVRLSSVSMYKVVARELLGDGFFENVHLV